MIPRPWSTTAALLSCALLPLLWGTMHRPSMGFVIIASTPGSGGASSTRYDGTTTTTFSSLHRRRRRAAFPPPVVAAGILGATMSDRHRRTDPGREATTTALSLCSSFPSNDYDTNDVDDEMDSTSLRRELDRREAAKAEGGGREDDGEEEEDGESSFEGYNLRDAIYDKWGECYDVEFQKVDSYGFRSVYLVSGWRDDVAMAWGTARVPAPRPRRKENYYTQHLRRTRFVGCRIFRSHSNIILLPRSHIVDNRKFSCGNGG